MSVLEFVGACVAVAAGLAVLSLAVVYVADRPLRRIKRAWLRFATQREASGTGPTLRFRLAVRLMYPYLNAYWLSLVKARDELGGEYMSLDLSQSEQRRHTDLSMMMVALVNVLELRHPYAPKERNGEGA